MGRLVITGVTATAPNVANYIGFGYTASTITKEADEITSLFPIKTANHSVYGVHEYYTGTLYQAKLFVDSAETTGVAAAASQTIPTDITVSIIEETADPSAENKFVRFATGAEYSSLAEDTWTSGTGTDLPATGIVSFQYNASVDTCALSQNTVRNPLLTATTYQLVFDAANEAIFYITDSAGDEQAVVEGETVVIDGYSIEHQIYDIGSGTTTLASLVSDIMPMIIGVPKLFVERTLLRAAIEFCEESEVLQQEILVSSASGIHEYQLVSESTYTIPHKVLWVLYNGNLIEPLSTQLLESRYPKWRDNSGTPEVFVRIGIANLRLVPVPSTDGINNMVVYTILKPSSTATTLPTRVVTDYREELINSTVYRLLRMPNVEWSDPNSAQLYRTLYEEGLVTAKRRAKQQDTGIARCAKYGGIGGSNTRSKLRRLRW